MRKKVFDFQKILSHKKASKKYSYIYISIVQTHTNTHKFVIFVKHTHQACEHSVLNNPEQIIQENWSTPIAL